MTRKSKIRPGDTFKTNNFGDVVVIEKINANEVIVTFIDTGTTVTVCPSQLANGRIRDRYKPVIAGVGFSGVGKYSRVKNRKTNAVWIRILKVCHCNEKKRYSVCSEWHNFQNFAEWYESNKPNIEGRVTLIPTDNHYSPDTCYFDTKSPKSSHKAHCFVSPGGVEKFITNRAEQCRDNKLDYSSMLAVKSGDLKQYKGWLSK